jgi:cyclopropane fatty-acyl-phospholipid synthase-like methyltransferase
MRAPDDPRLSSPAALRNRGPILEVLRDVLPSAGRVLEIASGTGEHVVHFARHLPDLVWQPSDPSPQARASIAAWIEKEGGGNIALPLEIDASAPIWPVTNVDAVVAINVVHISPWSVTEGLMKGTDRLLQRGGALFLYGPYRRSDRELEVSNMMFDMDLRARNPEWGIRSVEDVERAAEAWNMRLDRMVEMPANNVSLILRHV